MKVFISYSTSETAVVKRLAGYVEQFAEVTYWDKSKEPGNEVWPTIFKWIDEADLVLVLITGNTVQRAMSVGQEVGRANTKGKLIVPLVTPEVPSAELGFLSSITFERLDRDNPGPALRSIRRTVERLEERQRQRDALFFVGGLLTVLWLGSK